MDMFRNPKLAAAVYAAQQDETPVLEVSSAMDIGEHPAGNRGRLFAFTNADSVRMYKNGLFIREYTHADSPYRHMSRPPIEIDDFLGEQVARNEGFAPSQARMVKDLLNHSARFGSSHLPPKIMAKAAWLMLRYRMSFGDAYQFYGKYIGNWGAAATVYRFEAVRDGKVVRTVERAPVEGLRLRATAGTAELREGDTYDAALIRLAMTDQNGNVLPFWQGAVTVETEGPVAVLGPREAILRGGLGGTIIKTTGCSGEAAVTFRVQGAESVTLRFTVTAAEE